MPAALPSAGQPAGLPSAVLWDMDGTLVDTEPLWFAAEQDLARRYGVPWSDAASRELVGMPLEVYGAAMVDLGVTAPVQQVVDELVAVVRAALLTGPTWQPGVQRLLADLVAAGVPCAMVTMSYLSLAEPVAAGAPAGAFRVLVTGEQVEHGKPHPEPYLRAAEALGVPIEECVAIEDSPPGITSAMAAGARTLGVPHVLPVQARPGLSRVPDLTHVGLAELARMRAGEVLDLIG